MRGGDELDAALRDCAGGVGVQLDADFVYDDDLRHVVLHRLYHHAVLEGGGRNLHAARAPDGGVRNVAVPRDFVRGVHDDDAPMGVVRQRAGDFAQHRGLAHAGLAEKKDALARHYQVFDDPYRAVNGASDAQCQAYYLPAAVANCGYAVERPLDSGAVVLAEIAQTVYDVADFLRRDLRRIQNRAAVAEPRLRLSAEVHDDLQQAVKPPALSQRLSQAAGELV